MVFTGLKRWFNKGEINKAKEFLSSKKQAGEISETISELLGALENKQPLSADRLEEIIDAVILLGQEENNTIDSLTASVEVWKNIHTLLVHDHKKFAPLARAIDRLIGTQNSLKKEMEEFLESYRSLALQNIVYTHLTPETKKRLLQLHKDKNQTEFNQVLVQALEPLKDRIEATPEKTANIYPHMEYAISIEYLSNNALQLLWNMHGELQKQSENQGSLSEEFTKWSGILVNQSDKNVVIDNTVIPLVPTGIPPENISVQFVGFGSEPVLIIEYPSPNYGLNGASKNSIKIGPGYQTGSFEVNACFMSGLETQDPIANSQALSEYLVNLMREFALPENRGYTAVLESLPGVKKFNEEKKILTLENGQTIDFNKNISGFLPPDFIIQTSRDGHPVIVIAYKDVSNDRLNAFCDIYVRPDDRVNVLMFPRSGYEAEIEKATNHRVTDIGLEDVPKTFDQFLKLVETAPKNISEITPPPLPPEPTPEPAFGMLKGIKNINLQVGLLSFEKGTQIEHFDLGDVPDTYILKPDLIHSQTEKNFVIEYALATDPQSVGAQLKFTYDDNGSITKIEALKINPDNTKMVIASKTAQPLAELSKIFAQFEFILEQDLETAKPKVDTEAHRRAPAIEFDEHSQAITYKGAPVRLSIPGFSISKFGHTHDNDAFFNFKSNRPDLHDRSEYVQAIFKPDHDGFVNKIEVYRVTPAKDSHHADEKIYIGESSDKVIRTADALKKNFSVLTSLVHDWQVYAQHHGHDDHGHSDHGHTKHKDDHGHTKHKDDHGHTKHKEDHGHAKHKDDHGHDAPKPVKDKFPPKPDRWVEVGDEPSPVVDLDSRIVIDLVKSSPEIKKVMMDIFKSVLDNKPAAELQFRSLFDGVESTDDQSPQALFLKNLEKQHLNLDTFKKMWRETLYTDVLAQITKATAADVREARLTGGSKIERFNENLHEYAGYKTEILSKAAMAAAGGAIGYSVSEYFELDELAVEAEKAAITGGAMGVTRWLGSGWRDAAKKFKSWSDKSINEGRKNKEKAQTKRVRAQLDNQEYADYLSEKMSQWLAQSVREVSLKKSATAKDNPAHLHVEDDPNLYLFRLEAVKAIEHEYAADNDLKKKRLADLDKYVNTLNLNRYASGLNRAGIVKQYQEGKGNKDKWLAAVAKVDSGFLWAQAKSEELRQKGHVESMVLGVAAGVALWGASLPYKRLIQVAAGAKLGYEFGEHLDARSAVQKINRETLKLQQEVEATLQSFSTQDIDKLVATTVQLQNALTLGMLNDSLKLQVQDTLHKIRLGEFFETVGDARQFKLDLLIKSTDQAGAKSQSEIKRLGESTMNIRKWLGAVGGGLTAFLAGRIFGK